MPRERETIESQTRIVLRDTETLTSGPYRHRSLVHFDGQPVAAYFWSGGGPAQVSSLPHMARPYREAVKFAEGLAPIAYPDDLEVPTDMMRLLEALARRAMEARRTAGLTAGDDRALAALGVERLPEGWVSVTLRFKLPKEEAERARAMSSAERSEALRRGLARG